MAATNQSPCHRCINSVSWTNDPTKLNKIVCSQCHAAVKAHCLEGHVVKEHEFTLLQYLEKHGARFNYVEKRFHKCLLCNHIMVFNGDILQAHTKSKHNMSQREYTNKYLNKDVRTLELRPSFEIIKYSEYITEYYHRVFFMGHWFSINILWDVVTVRSVVY